MFIPNCAARLYGIASDLGREANLIDQSLLSRGPIANRPPSRPGLRSALLHRSSRRQKHSRRLTPHNSRSAELRRRPDRCYTPRTGSSRCRHSRRCCHRSCASSSPRQCGTHWRPPVVCRGRRSRPGRRGSRHRPGTGCGRSTPRRNRPGRRGSTPRRSRPDQRRSRSRCCCSVRQSCNRRSARGDK